MQRAKRAKGWRSLKAEKALRALPVVPMHLRVGRPPSVRKGFAQMRYRTKRRKVQAWVNGNHDVSSVEQLNACMPRTIPQEE